MKKLLLATVIALVPLTAHASGWQLYYNCGEGVVVIIGGWRDKLFLTIEDNGKELAIGGAHYSKIMDGKIYDAGTDSLHKEPELDANVSNFRYRVKWHEKTVIFSFKNTSTGQDKATFAGHLCRQMGTEYDEEVKQYQDDSEKYLKEHLK
jgi:hypothetical protein